MCAHNFMLIHEIVVHNNANLLVALHRNSGDHQSYKEAQPLTREAGTERDWKTA